MRAEWRELFCIVPPFRDLPLAVRAVVLHVAVPVPAIGNERTEEGGEETYSAPDTTNERVSLCFAAGLKVRRDGDPSAEVDLLCL